jgi:hypothetical protein
VDERVSFIDHGHIGGHFTVCARLLAGKKGENEKQVRKRSEKEKKWHCMQ